ncbi:MAG: GNAT family N-acetyltransferase [Clostridia bacterium]|nr:GNAT family N-acetyltransferase [Clostridia bacterium]
MNKKGYTLRKYNNEDYEFIYETKKNAYKEYVEHCWGKWDDLDQRNRFKESMEKTFDRTYIIMVDNKRIGFYQGQAVNEEIYYIENICIIPEYQGKGIGTEILKSILEKYSDKNIEIQYFKQNPVGNLYEKLGFVQNGETEFHYQMIKYK